MDREEISRLVGHKVAVRLNSVEARGVEIVATLEEVRDDGIVLSEISEFGPEPRYSARGTRSTGSAADRIG